MSTSVVRKFYTALEQLWLSNYQFLLPFFWPQENPHLKLAYVGVGLCLLADRILNILIPLQLGQILAALSENGACYIHQLCFFVTCYAP